MPDGTYPLLAQYVVTDDPLAPSPLVRQVDRDPVGFVATLKRQLGKGIWLCGGGDLATQLLDEIWVKFTPPLPCWWSWVVRGWASCCGHGCLAPVRR